MTRPVHGSQQRVPPGESWPPLGSLPRDLAQEGQQPLAPLLRGRFLRINAFYERRLAELTLEQT